MKISVYLTALILLELSTNIQGSCDIVGKHSRGYVVKELHCTEFNDNFLAYSNEYENVTKVFLVGDFTEISFDSRFTKLSYLRINSISLVHFNINNVNNLTSLTYLNVNSNRKMTVDLNVTGESNTLENLSLFLLRRVENILGSFTYFVNLEFILLYQYEKETFDFSLLPNSLGRLIIYSSREVNLVNEICLKRLPQLTELNLGLSQTTFNASFIPSSLQNLSVKNLISQEDLVGTNITSLKMSKSQTPLEFIPSKLRELTLDYYSELSANCEHFQQSKVEQLSVRYSKKKRPFYTKCLPNITTLIMNRVQTQLEFIQPSLRTLRIAYTDLNVTCENLRQSKIENLSISNGITRIYVSNNATESLFALQYYNQLHQDCTLAEMPAETVTSRAEVTTGRNVVTTSASPRLTSTVSASIVSAVASFLLLIVVTSQ